MLLDDRDRNLVSGLASLHAGAPCPESQDDVCDDFHFSVPNVCCSFAGESSGFERRRAVRGGLPVERNGLFGRCGHLAALSRRPDALGAVPVRKGASRRPAAFRRETNRKGLSLPPEAIRRGDHRTNNFARSLRGSAFSGSGWNLVQARWSCRRVFSGAPEFQRQREAPSFPAGPVAVRSRDPFRAASLPKPSGGVGNVPGWGFPVELWTCLLAPRGAAPAAPRARETFLVLRKLNRKQPKPPLAA